ncbi:UNVERIFIED_CONTAM: hypothetical protein Slati_2692700 [Sesamum latifolium]|uniref:Ty3-gypsy retrotransposon protein n=1 Tax=Sesamum latifolium TaxID=2727402 RepID=A0AAW2VV16_9LAMI
MAMIANKSLTLKAAASSSNETIGVITRSMSKKAYPEVTIHDIVEKDLLHLGGINEDNGDLKDNSSSSTPRSTSIVAPVMVTIATTLEEQIANLTRAKESLAKHVQEQDSQISKLMNKIVSTDASHVAGNQAETHDEAGTSLKQQSNEREKSSTKEQQVSLEGLIPVDRLKECTMGTIQNKLGGSSKSSMTYTKPYTQRIDNLKMPVGYQPPKFQQFDDKGNPKQHVAHFIETCNNVGNYKDHLVKQFVQSFKENAFDWYTDLKANSI